MGENQRPVGQFEDLPEADFTDVDQVDDDPQAIESLDHLSPEVGQAALLVGRPAAVGVHISARVSQGRSAEAESVVEIEGSRIGAESLTALEGQHERDVPTVLRFTDIARASRDRQAVVPSYLVVEVPHHLHAATKRIREPTVVEVDCAELGGDPSLPPARQIVLTHASEPHRMRAHPELHEGRTLEPGRGRPIEIRHLDPISEAHLAFRPESGCRCGHR